MTSLVESPSDWRGPHLAKRTDWVHRLTADEIAEVEAGLADAIQAGRPSLK